MPLRILHLEDCHSDAELIRLKLQSAGLECEITVTKAKDDFTAALAEDGFDLILSDYSLPTFNGLTALELARQRHARIPFIFVSATMGKRPRLRV